MQKEADNQNTKKGVPEYSVMQPRQDPEILLAEAEAIIYGSYGGDECEDSICDDAALEIELLYADLCTYGAGCSLAE